MPGLANGLYLNATVLYITEVSPAHLVRIRLYSLDWYTHWNILEGSSSRDFSAIRQCRCICSCCSVECILRKSCKGIIPNPAMHTLRYPGVACYCCLVYSRDTSLAHDQGAWVWCQAVFDDFAAEVEPWTHDRKRIGGYTSRLGDGEAHFVWSNLEGHLARTRHGQLFTLQ